MIGSGRNTQGFRLLLPCVTDVESMSAHGEHRRRPGPAVLGGPPDPDPRQASQATQPAAKAKAKTTAKAKPRPRPKKGPKQAQSRQRTPAIYHGALLFLLITRGDRRV